MHFDDAKFDEFAAEVRKELTRQDAEIKRLSASDGKRESELIALRELIEQKGWK